MPTLVSRLPWKSFAGILLVILTGFLLAQGGCNRNDYQPPPNPEIKEAELRRKAKNPPPKVTFADVTKKSGIAFHHTNGSSPHKLLPETLGSGVAFLDFDNDGHQDLLFVNSCYWPGFEDKDKPPPTLKLYRNQGDGTFKDVTAAAGLQITLYGLGVAVGDYNNDGFPDVFITAVGGNRLFQNVPDGKGRKFLEVTHKAGDLAKTWNWPNTRGNDFLNWNPPISFSTSAAFLDYDKDGHLDLFVCNYVQWSPKLDLTQPFNLQGIGRAFGPPTTFAGTQCRLYRNRGDGTFADVTRAAGIEVTGELGSGGKPVAKALGVAVCDPDEDGWPDIAVANDTVRNFFFHNQGNGTFKEKGQETGVAYADGKARGAMGIDWGEYRPGQCALLIGNFANEPDTFFRLDDAKRLLFSDVAHIEGIAGPSRLPLVFGVMFFDYDLDGRLDFLTANGHLEPDIKKVFPAQDYAQAVQLFWNTGDKPGFELVTPAFAGGDLFRPQVGRGCAFADIDGDGRLDVVLTANGGPARLLRNEGGANNNWIRLILEGDGKRCNRSALGARVVLTAAGHTQKRELVAARGYLSQSELPLTFGLGKAAKVDRLVIHWPGKNLPPQVLTDLAVNKVHRIRLRGR